MRAIKDSYMRLRVIRSKGDWFTSNTSSFRFDRGEKRAPFLYRLRAVFRFIVLRPVDALDTEEQAEWKPSPESLRLNNGGSQSSSHSQALVGCRGQHGRGSAVISSLAPMTVLGIGSFSGVGSSQILCDRSWPESDPHRVEDSEPDTTSSTRQTSVTVKLSLSMATFRRGSSPCTGVRPFGGGSNFGVSGREAKTWRRLPCASTQELEAGRPSALRHAPDCRAVQRRSECCISS